MRVGHARCSHAAFQVRRGYPAADSCCLARVVVDLRPNGKVVVLDRGGDYEPVSTGEHGPGSSRRHYRYESPGPDNGYE